MAARFISIVTCALALAGTLCTRANAVARTPSISGNGWAALLLICGFIAFVVLLVRGVLALELRDARLWRDWPFDHWN